MTYDSLRKLNLSLLVFFTLACAAYFFLNAQPYLEILRYDLLLNSPFAPTSGLDRSQILAVQPQVQTRTPASLSVAEMNSLTLVVPKISVTAPITTPRDASKEGILASLESGVGLYPNSVEPGETGRAVLLGHSSRAGWYRGNYAYVFSLLDKLQTDDEFYVSSARQKFIYRVFDALTLSSDQTNQLTQGPAQGSELDLITCYPVGSASQRTVVRAELVATQNY